MYLENSLVFQCTQGYAGRQFILREIMTIYSIMESISKLFGCLVHKNEYS